MLLVKTEIIIDVPLNLVYAYVADPDNAPEWYENIDSMTWITDKKVVQGAKMDFRARFMGRELAYTYEITQLIPNEIMVMATNEGPLAMTTVYEWSKVDEGRTRFLLINKGEPKGFAKVAKPLMSTMMAKANKKDLENLKIILEAV